MDTQLDPFDDTRVHPECYNTQDWAQRVCANALDVQVGLSGRGQEGLGTRHAPLPFVCWYHFLFYSLISLISVQI